MSEVTSWHAQKAEDILETLRREEITQTFRHHRQNLVMGSQLGFLDLRDFKVQSEIPNVKFLQRKPEKAFVIC